MITDTNLIAYEYFKNQYVPKEVYVSGEKEETKLINKYSNKKESAPILSLEDDIINDEGYGLKKGFYSVIPDKYLDFLLLYQSGKLKAKVPVVSMEVYETNNPKQEKIKKMSAKKFAREQEKEYRKYMNGQNPQDVDWKEAKIYKTDEKNSWIIIYNSNNIQLSGVIKF
ncbi:MAG: hypothetical protein IJB79_06480 [Candidatus Gastranaerophilales bacterium]|nr:hypothetical protein [Candidatus Gastranaerophilales bacterium]